MASDYQLRDLRQWLPYAFAFAKLQLGCRLSTLYMRLIFRWWLVPLGAGAKFYGVLRLRRHPLARISVGARSVFRSHPAANPGGLKCPCSLTVMKGGELRIGDDCGFSGTAIVVEQLVTIGDRVFCGANSVIVDGDHHPVNAERRITQVTGDIAPIHIGNDVFLGMNVAVIKGAKIGDGAVIAANAVVNSEIPAGAIAGGVPAKVIGWVKDYA